MKLIKALIIVFALLQSPSAFSQDAGATTQAESLKDIMKQMGPKFGAIGKQVNTPETNAASAVLANELSSLTIKALILNPSHLSQLPADQQLAAIIQYRLLIAKLLQISLELEQAFTANDNELAQKLFMQMGELRSQGHMEFRN